MANLGEVTVGLRAETAQFQSAMRGAAATTAGVQQQLGTALPIAADSGIRGVNRLQNAVANLGLGISAAIGGGVFAVATVVVGSLVKRFGDLRDAADSSAEGVRRAAEAVALLDDKERSRAARLLAEARETRKALLRELQTPGGPFGESAGEQIRERINRFQAGLRPVGEIRKDLQGVNAEIVKLVASLAEMDARDADKPVREFWGSIRGTDDAIKALNATFDQFLAKSKQPVLFTKSGVLGIERAQPDIPAGPSSADLNALANRLEEGLEPILAAAEKRRKALIDAGRAIGEVIGDGVSRGLARSLLAGVKDLADVLKNVFRAALEELLAYLIKSTILKAIAQVIGAAIPGGGGFLGGILSGLGFSKAAPVGAVVGAATANSRSATIVVPVSAIPPSPSLLLQARDAQWQTLIGETVRVMEGLGYRFQYA